MRHYQVVYEQVGSSTQWGTSYDFEGTYQNGESLAYQFLEKKIREGIIPSDKDIRVTITADKVKDDR